MLVDLIITVPLVLVWCLSFASSVGLSLGILASWLQERPWLAQAGTLVVGTVAWVVLAAASLALLVLTLYQWFLLSTAGQTIGKRVMGIRIVDLDGRPAGFFSALLLRSLVFAGLMSLVVSFTSVLIPFAGVVLWLLDYLPAFGEDRRCLHDYFAGTQVRWVRIVEVYVGRIFGAAAGVALVGASVVAVLNRAALVTLFHRGNEVARVVAPPVSPPLQLAPSPVREPVVAVVPPAPVGDAERAVPAPVAAPPPEKKVYQYTDEHGGVHVTDDLSTVPTKFREKVITL